MNKLTLTVDPEVVQQAKAYAAQQQQSLSKLVENYLKSLPRTEHSQAPQLTGAVADLAGIISEKELEDARNYIDFLQDKYQ
ncbi:DUF6364 family protein [Endozoicomonas acroporae]|uniref:DUF6364 family protein n=1 Tax=Endozoicomonas acroporae TaxID=1701104 RepID=UPI000C77A80D|nr:DUF6364 family protein [Endozoicomonas acroporae]